MAPPKLDDRDVSTICGFLYDTATPGNILSLYCDNGLPCNIDRYVTPNIAFCSTDGLLPWTKFYSYGGWPQGGCGIGEACCPSDIPIIQTVIYDNGATYFYSCGTSSFTVSLYTQLQGYSVLLAPYTTIDATTSTSTTAAPTVVTVTWIPSSTTASLRPVTSTASSTTTSSSGTTVPQASPSNEIALVAGLGAGIPIIVLAASISIIVIFLRRRSKQARTHPGTQTVIEVDQTNLGGNLTR
ncbi:hypothetical protein V8E54_007972 [Elaphomyces granulatus]